MALTFYTALLPRPAGRVCALSHEIPRRREWNAERERELAEFVDLAFEMGAVGFFREDVKSCSGMVIVRRVKRDASIPAHPEAVERTSKASANHRNTKGSEKPVLSAIRQN